MNFPEKKYKNLDSFYDDYVGQLIYQLNNLDKKKLLKAANLISEKIKKNKNIFICGNGGSASLANHMLCDYTKTLRQNSNLKPKVISLVSNLELITAISNDIRYDDIFSYQAESLCSTGDLIIMFSSSGNSKNLVNLIKFAKKKKLKVLSFIGFSGGYLKNNSDISVYFPINNYGISEDCNHIMMHLILQFLKQNEISTKKIVKSTF